MLQVAVIGLSHKFVDLKLLELFSKASQALKGEKMLFFSHPTVVLQTCNRFEIYFGAKDLGLAHSELLSFLRPHIREPFEHQIYSFFGFDCFFHLSRVASGLDSAVVGESEIQGQVKRAYLDACKMQKLSSSMHYLFQKSLKIGKTIRNSFIPRNLNLADAVIEIAQHTLESFKDKSFLLIGNSRLNRSILTILKKRWPKSISMVTKSPKESVDPHVLLIDQKAIKNWREYDCVIAATTCDDPLIFPMDGSFTILFDLGVPRNIDPSVKNANDVLFYPLEKIYEWIEKKEKIEQAEIYSKEKILKYEVIKLTRLYRLKNLRALGSGGKGSHLECFPFPLSAE